MIYKIDKIFYKDLDNYGNSNCNKSIKYPKFLNFFINFKSRYFKPLKIILKIILKVDNSKMKKINKNINKKSSNLDNSNSSNNIKYF